MSEVKLAELARQLLPYLPISDVVTVTQAGNGGGVTDHGALSGLADDDHDQYTRGVPDNVSVASTNAEGSTHTHAVTASNNPLVSSSLLKTGAAGDLYLAGDFGVDTDTIYVDVSEDAVYINQTAIPTRTGALVVKNSATGQRTLVLTGGGSQTVPILDIGDTTTSQIIVTKDFALESKAFAYQKGVSGWQIAANGDAEFNNVRVRGSIRASVFEYGDIQATAGSVLISKSASKMYQDWTSPANTIAAASGYTGDIYIDNDEQGTPLFAGGDILRIKTITTTGVAQVWLKIYASAGTADYTIYSCYLMSGDTSTNFAKGTAVADYGTAGDGLIYLSADDVIGASANISLADYEYGELLSAVVHDGGSGYAVSNVCVPAGPGSGATLRVDSVGGGGEVITFTITAGGSDYTPGVKATSGGSGSGFQIRVTGLSGPWTSERLLGRIGNMNGSYGTGAVDRYGMGFGDYATENYMTYNAETANGLVIKAQGGNVTIGGIYAINIMGTSSYSLTRAIHFEDDVGTTVSDFYIVDSPYHQLWISTVGTNIQVRNSLAAQASATYEAMSMISANSGGIGVGFISIDADSNRSPTSLAVISSKEVQIYGPSVTNTFTRIWGDIEVVGGGDIYSWNNAWQDYSASSTIVGWTSYTTKQIYYKKVGNLVFVFFYVAGTSDSTSTTFSLPHASISPTSATFVRVQDSGTWLPAGLGWLPAGSTFYAYTTSGGASWTASGTKTIVGQFWYEAQ